MTCVRLRERGAEKVEEGLLTRICVRQLKLADLIRRVGPNEWGSTLEWCSRDPVWVGEAVRGTGVPGVTESHRQGV